MATLPSPRHERPETRRPDCESPGSRERSRPPLARISTQRSRDWGGRLGELSGLASSGLDAATWSAGLSLGSRDVRTDRVGAVRKSGVSIGRAVTDAVLGGAFQADIGF